MEKAAAVSLIWLSSMITEGSQEQTGEICRYFIEVLESYNNGTISNLKGKVQQENEDNKTVVLCFSLEQREDLSENFKMQ